MNQSERCANVTTKYNLNVRIMYMREYKKKFKNQIRTNISSNCFHKDKYIVLRFFVNFKMIPKL